MKKITPALMTPQRSTAEQGFTLIEVIMVLILVGILSTITVRILSAPFQAFQDQSRRATLTAEADLALTRMVREIRLAVPNSVRVSSDGHGQYLEFIPTIDGGRYRFHAPDATPMNPDHRLSCGSGATPTRQTFEVLGGLLTGQARPNDYVIVYNASTTGTEANAYAGGANPTGQSHNRAQINAISSSTTTTITLTQAHRFPRCSGSPEQRFHIAPQSGPVTFYCQGDSLYRITGYGYQTTQPTLATAFGGTTAGVHRLTQNVAACDFSYDPGTHVRNAVVSLSLSLQQEDEYVRLLYQAQVVNVP